MSSYDQGTVVKCYTVTPFTRTGVAADPLAVNFLCQKPDGTSINATYTAGADPSNVIVKDSTGTYHANVTASLAGTYTYQFYTVSAAFPKTSSTGTFTCTGDTLI